MKNRINDLQHTSGVMFLLKADDYDGAIFDMDGVITQTAKIHAEAWKKTFDQLLNEQFGSAYTPFDIETDYLQYVDGKIRESGIRDFLASRGIKLPEGSSNEAPSLYTVNGVGTIKNRLFLRLVKTRGVKPYPSTLDFISNLRRNKIKIGVITASKNGRRILEAAKATKIFDVLVDGLETARLNLRGKPYPDVFLKAAELLHVEPSRTIVVEDAVAGVAAGFQGKFKTVIGVNRGGNEERLRQHGASIVVNDLAEVRLRDKQNTKEAEERRSQI